jgi:hypothetical protein
MHENAYYLDCIRLSYAWDIITIGIRAMLGIIDHGIRVFMSEIN